MNDFETQKFSELEQQLKPYKKILKQAADIILVQDVSKYPIFVVHQQEISIGLPLIEKNGINFLWSINASTLEEFVTKGIIFEQNIDEFIKKFKDPNQFVCTFVLSELGAQFIFLSVA